MHYQREQRERQDGHRQRWKSGEMGKNGLTGFELKFSWMLPKRSGEAKSTDKLKEKDLDIILPL